MPKATTGKTPRKRLKDGANVNIVALHAQNWTMQHIVDSQ